jgi:hypothetical protein
MKSYQKGNKAGNRVNCVFCSWNGGIFLRRDLFLIEILIDQALFPVGEYRDKFARIDLLKSANSCPPVVAFSSPLRHG